MPYALGVHSFSFRDVLADRLVVTAGTAVYDAVNRPPHSGSRTSIGGAGLAFYAPWHDDEHAGLFEPSGEELWAHYRYYTEQLSGGAALRLGVARDGVEYVSISADDSGRPTIRVAGTVRATAADTVFEEGSWSRLHLQLTGTAAGDEVRVYAEGDLSLPVARYTLLAADVTALAGVGAPNGFLAATKTTATADRLDDFVALDPEDAAFPGIYHFARAHVTDQPFTGPGAEQGMAGDYTAIDETPPNGDEALVASAPGQESTFTKAPIAADNVFVVVLRARVERVGSDAGESLVLRARAGSDAVQATVAAPEDGAVQHSFEVAPDGLALSPDRHDATRYGFESAA